MGGKVALLREREAEIDMMSMLEMIDHLTDCMAGHIEIWMGALGDRNSA